MLTWRVAGALAGLFLLNLNVTTCRSPGEGAGPQASANETATDVNLASVDTSDLTSREKRQWSAHVSELLAPCPNQPVSLAQCVSEKRDCKACEPAAEYLVEQVRRGLTKSQVELAFRARFAPDQVKKIDIEGSPSKGPTDAPVTIVEWADFECPACKAAKPALEALMKAHPSAIRLVFKHYPLSIHPNAEKAARAAVAAQKQGEFWKLHSALFSAEPPLTPQKIEQLAKAAGLDMKQFKADWESEAVADLVAKDRKLGNKVDLSGTPTLFINGRRFVYAQDFKSELEGWVDLELELTTGKKAPPSSELGKNEPEPEKGTGGSPEPSTEAKKPKDGAEPTKAAKTAEPAKAAKTEPTKAAKTAEPKPTEAPQDKKTSATAEGSGATP